MIKKVHLVIGGLILLAPVSSVKAETLRQAVEAALAAHPSVEAAQAAIHIVRQEKKEQRSGYFPELNASTSWGRIFGDNSTSRGLTVDRGQAYSWLWEGSGSMTQLIFDGFETRNRVQAVGARLESEEYNVSDVKENLAFQTVQAYITVLQMQHIIHRTQSYRKQIQNYKDRIEDMVAEGAADESEAAQARDLDVLLERVLIEYQGQLDAAYASYKQFVGRMPLSNLQLPQISASQLPANVDNAIAQASLDHPLVLSLQKQAQAIEYDIEAEKGGFFPDLSGELSYLKRDQVEEIGGELVDGRALIKMNWTFATGGAQSARVKRSRAEYAESIAQQKEAIRQIEGDVRRSYAQFEMATRQFNLLNKREKVLKDLFEAYEVQFEGARVRLLQLMQSENDLFNTQIDLMNAKYQYLLSQYAVLASMGDLQHYFFDMPAMLRHVHNSYEHGQSGSVRDSEIPIQQSPLYKHYKQTHDRNVYPHPVVTKNEMVIGDIGSVSVHKQILQEDNESTAIDAMASETEEKMFVTEEFSSPPMKYDDSALHSWNDTMFSSDVLAEQVEQSVASSLPVITHDNVSVDNAKVKTKMPAIRKSPERVILDYTE